MRLRTKCFFKSEKQALFLLIYRTKGWNVISIITYLAWHSCFNSHKTVRNQKIRLFRQLCVQEFSGDTELNELPIMQMGKLG